MLDRPAPDGSLLPRSLRRPALCVVAVAAVAFTVLALHVAGESWGARLDIRIDGALGMHGSLFGRRAEFMISFGSPTTVVGMAGLGALAALWLRRYRLAALAVLGPGLTGIATTLLKPLVGRTIDGEYSFPSGHTAGAASVGLVLAIAVVAVARPGRRDTALVLLLVPLVPATVAAVGMIVAQAHYPTDTVGGFCTAVVVVVGTALALNALPARTRAG